MNKTSVAQTIGTYYMLAALQQANADLKAANAKLIAETIDFREAANAVFADYQNALDIAKAEVARVHAELAQHKLQALATPEA